MSIWRSAESREKRRLYNRARRQEIKLRVIQHYGGKCAKCRVKDPDMLTIDHMDNDGAEHRRAVNVAAIYSDIIKRGFPPGYQILCANHNLKKHLELVRAQYENLRLARKKTKGHRRVASRRKKPVVRNALKA